jgi:hypothetical protein
MKARKKGAEKRCEKIRLSPSTVRNTRNGWEELTVHKGENFIVSDLYKRL